MKGKKLNLVGRVALGIALALGSNSLKAESLNLQLNHSFVGSDYTADTFNARYDTEDGDISNGYDIKDVKQTPNTSDNNFIQAYTIDTGFTLTEDYKVFDPTETYWDIKLMAEDYVAFQGFTGTARVEVDDTTAITNLDSSYDVYLNRYDEDGTFVEGYNLRDPNNYTIDWSVTKALGNYTNLELIVGYATNYADFDDDGYVNFKDYSMLASNWQDTGADLTGDLDEDEDIDMDDLALFVDEWLWSRAGGY